MLAEETTKEIEYTEATYKSHNGIVTIKNPETNGHRTFKIRTQSQDANFAPGSRIVYLLDGPNNETDYRPFGFANESGVHVWKRYGGQDSVYGTYGRMLSKPESFKARGLEYHFSGHCRICNRRLTHPDSIESGIGPVCAEKLGM